MQCESVAEVLELLPLEYWEALKKGIYHLADLAYKYQQLAGQVERLKSQIASNTLLALIKGMKVLALQVSKEMKILGQTELGAFKQAHSEY